MQTALKSKENYFLLDTDEFRMEFSSYRDMMKYVNDCWNKPDNPTAREVSFRCFRGLEINPIAQGKFWVI